MSSTEDEELSIRLSTRMQRAGFRAANARVQAAMASALQDIVHFLLKINIHVFGSFADGWGSCLTRLDGRVGDDSDIDVTVITKGQPLHLDDAAPGASRCEPRHEYKDGHVSCPAKAPGPNLQIKKCDLPPTMPDIDLIAAVPCSRYPHIQLLQPGYKSRTGRKSHISSHILQALSQELQSPRCHAVAASPPGQDGKWMRVSTTLLERLVMHHLTTVQGQFFILVKFLIKKVISHRVNGLKTYMAKNLLFYMLDETPAEDWQPQNLVPLVRQSLQILVAMMESSASDHVCMTHFFLRDASVYLKKDHDAKEKIVEAVAMVTEQLHPLLCSFQETLAKYEVNVVLFRIYAMPLVTADLLASKTSDAFCQFYYIAFDLNERLSDEDTECSESDDLKQMLVQVDEAFPDYAAASKECFRAMILCKMGKQLNCVSDPASISSLGCVRCPDGDAALSVDEAKAIVLSQLQQMTSLGIEVSDGSMSSCAVLSNDFYMFQSLVSKILRGQPTTNADLLMAVLAAPKMAMLVFGFINNYQYDKLQSVMRRFTRHLELFLLPQAGNFSGTVSDTAEQSQPPDEEIEDSV